MSNAGNNRVYIESLSAMKKSLENSYELNAAVQDESNLFRGIGEVERGYIEFAGYLRNEGMRRLRDITETISKAVDEISCCDSLQASTIYLETLKSVLLQTRLAKVLESRSEQDKKTHYRY